MITQKIKDILGADLTGQVEGLLKGKGKEGADLDLVVGNDGSFGSAATHELMVNQNKQAEETIKTVAEHLKALGASGDTKTLAADVLKVKGDFDTLQNGNAQAMTKLQKETALKLGLGAGVYDAGDVISRIDLDKVELDDRGNLKSDLDELTKSIRESAPHYFKPVGKDGVQLRGAVPGQMGGGGADDVDTQVIDSAFGLKGDK